MGNDGFLGERVKTALWKQAQSQTLYAGFYTAAGKEVEHGRREYHRMKVTATARLDRKTGRIVHILILDAAPLAMNEGTRITIFDAPHGGETLMQTTRKPPITKGEALTIPLFDREPAGEAVAS